MNWQSLLSRKLRYEQNLMPAAFEISAFKELASLLFPLAKVGYCV